MGAALGIVAGLLLLSGADPIVVGKVVLTASVFYMVGAYLDEVL